VRSPTAATRLFAVLGDPVSHSRSPLFQNAAMRAANIDAVYVALRCDREALPALMRTLAAAGGGGNVTVPHKRVAAEALDRRTAVVERTGACNTFWMRDGELWGDNTDVAGVEAAIRALLASVPRRVLVLGAGGAASAVLAALEAMGVEEVSIVNRTIARAQELRARFADGSLRISIGATVDELDSHPWHLAVNATSLGLREGELPKVGSARFESALDLVYAPGGTAWIRELHGIGIPAADGTEMLLRQGAAAFRQWFGHDPDLDVMRAALR
jgi:shikimate dehydrogenase